MSSERIRSIAGDLPKDPCHHLVGEGTPASAALATFLDGVVERAPNEGRAFRDRLERDSVMLYLAKNKPLGTIGVLYGTWFVLHCPVAVTGWQRHAAMFRLSDIAAMRRWKPLLGLGPLTLAPTLKDGIAPLLPSGMDAKLNFNGYFDEWSLEDCSKPNREAHASFFDTLVTNGEPSPDGVPRTGLLT